MTKEYEQARDAAADEYVKVFDDQLIVQNLEPVHRAIYRERIITIAHFKDGATFATDYWAKEIEELKRDRERLEWWFSNPGCWPMKCGTKYFITFNDHSMQEGLYDTPREAIDAAMKEGE